MNPTAVTERLEAANAIDASCTDRAEITGALAGLHRVSAYVEAQRLRLVALLAKTAAFPEHDLSEATRSGLRDAMRTVERAELVDAAPAFGSALAAGEVSGAHVEVWGRALRQLEPAERTVLEADHERWAQVAGRSTPGQLKGALEREVRRLHVDGGMARFERQQRATRLSTGFDGDGMWFLRGVFDPKAGLLLANRLHAEVERLFTDTTPASCPSDPLARQDHLRALALASLLQGNGRSSGRPEWVIIEDRRHPAEPVIDAGTDSQLPDPVLADLKARAAVHYVVVEDGQVVKAPGQLNLGRSQRLANPAQRRVLRALYPTCAIGDCPVRFPNLKIHHIDPWEHDGTTDLSNLLPVCVRHHHDIHDNGWQLHLAADRTLTITHPDGTTMTTGPPTRTAG